MEDYNNYQARVVELGKIRIHPNADKLMLTAIIGSQVIMGTDVKEGDLGLYFIGGTRLSVVFAEKNNLIRIKDPETGKMSGGLFDSNRKVRAQNLRGQSSDGFFIPIKSLDGVVPFSAWTRLSSGDSFSNLQGIEICNKFAPKYSKQQGIGNKNSTPKTRKPDPKMFLRHFDTAQLRFVMQDLIKNRYHDLFSITEKLHGTSQRTGNIEVEIKLPWWKRVLTGERFRKEYQTIIGTRKTIVNQKANQGGYYSNSFRVEASEPFMNLHKGETVYYEVVGYAGDKPIMGIGDNKLVSKDFAKVWGPTTIFS